MRLVAASILLVGCSPSKLPPQPEAPTAPENMTKFSDGIDTRSHKVAAAVTVVKENADKPEVVRAESSVALAMLPAPTEGDLAVAKARASKADQKDYKAAEEAARKLQAQIVEARSKMEADQREASRVSKLKDERIEQLTQEVVRVKKEASNNIWTLTGAGLAVIGALTTALAGPRIGIPLLLCGAFCGAVPFIVDSPYFIWLAIGTASAASGLGLWWAWDKVRDSVNSSDVKGN